MTAIDPPRPTSEARGRALVAQRSEGWCEVCHRLPATNVHHRQGRQVWNPWRAANLLHVCGSGTTGCHGDVTEHRVADYDMGWSVRRTGRATPETVPCLIWTATYSWRLVWLDNEGGYTLADVETGEAS